MSNEILFFKHLKGQSAEDIAKCTRLTAGCRAVAREIVKSHGELVESALSQIVTRARSGSLDDFRFLVGLKARWRPFPPRQ